MWQGFTLTATYERSVPPPPPSPPKKRHIVSKTFILEKLHNSVLVPFQDVPVSLNTFLQSLLPYFKTILEVLFRTIV